jgi:maltooligosyltrehalose trehalohydrolase
MGERLNHQIAPNLYKTASALLLLIPEVPMIFQGQEWAASTPFQYFTDHNAELGKLVTEGRRKEFGKFKAFNDPAIREKIPDPQAESTFQNSKLKVIE